jgi:hypothetical protein
LHATWEAELGRINSLRIAQAKKKKKKKLRLYVSGKKLSMVAWACHPSLGRIHKIGGSQSRPAWAKNETLSPK